MGNTVSETKEETEHYEAIVEKCKLCKKNKYKALLLFQEEWYRLAQLYKISSIRFLRKSYLYVNQSQYIVNYIDDEIITIIYDGFKRKALTGPTKYDILTAEFEVMSKIIEAKIKEEKKKM